MNMSVCHEILILILQIHQWIVYQVIGFTELELVPFRRWEVLKLSTRP